MELRQHVITPLGPGRIVGISYNVRITPIYMVELYTGVLEYFDESSLGEPDGPQDQPS